MRDIIWLDKDPNRPFLTQDGYKLKHDMEFPTEGHREDYLWSLHEKAIAKDLNKALAKIKSWEDASVFGKLKMWWRYQTPRKRDYLIAAGYVFNSYPGWK